MSEEAALKDDPEDESEEAEESEETALEEPDAEEATDNVGDASVEINVEELMQEFEGQSLANRLNREVTTRRRLEELMERRRASRDLEDFEDYEV